MSAQAPAILTYPLTYNSIRLNGPTLLYIDETGIPIQLQLEADQVLSIVTDWNATNHEDEDSDDAPVVLKPPLAGDKHLHGIGICGGTSNGE